MSFLFGISFNQEFSFKTDFSTYCLELDLLMSLIFCLISASCFLKKRFF